MLLGPIGTLTPASYTHLDVYKRQWHGCCKGFQRFPARKQPCIDGRASWQAYWKPSYDMPSVCPPGVKHQSPSRYLRFGRNLKRRTQQGAFLMAGKLTAAFRPAVLPAVDLMLAVPPESSFSSTASLIPADLPRCMKEDLSPVLSGHTGRPLYNGSPPALYQVLRLRFLFRIPAVSKAFFPAGVAFGHGFGDGTPLAKILIPASFRTKRYQDWDHAASNR